MAGGNAGPGGGESLLFLTDEQLREGLGWSRADIDEFRAAGRADEQVGASRPLQEDVAPSLPLPLPMAA